MAAAVLAAEAAIAADHILKSGEVSAMLKLGFLPSPPSSSPSGTPPPSSPSLPLGIFPDRHRRHPGSPSPRPLPPSFERRLAKLQERISGIPECGGHGDVELTVRGRDGFGVEMRVHRRVLLQKSRFFADNLVVVEGKARHAVEICECDDVELYVEVFALMYCHDLRARLRRMRLPKVLDFLKVSEAIMFEDGTASCLAHLEAVPWSKEDEEDKVVSALSHVQLHASVSEVLRRLYVEPCASSLDHRVISRILAGVFHAKNEKARREMKALVLGLLKQDAIGRNAGQKETFYGLCRKCLTSTYLRFSEAVRLEEGRRDRGALMGEIAREADNLLWIVEILIDKRMGEEFVSLWADQKELAALHAKLPCVHRFEISKITSQLCVAIGKGQVLVPRDARFSLLQTWLEALYADFGWMKRGCRLIDRREIEDGLSQTILTLSMGQQQTILMNWFERFLNKGDDCPNIHEAFETWWRRAFANKYPEDVDVSQLQTAVCDSQPS